MMLVCHVIIFVMHTVMV